jgi:hypothetical protein
MSLLPAKTLSSNQGATPMKLAIYYALGWTVDKLWSEFQQGQEIYLFSEISRPVLDPSQGPIPRVPEVSTQEVKRSGRETDIPSPSTGCST